MMKKNSSFLGTENEKKLAYKQHQPKSSGGGEPNPKYPPNQTNIAITINGQPALPVQSNVTVEGIKANPPNKTVKFKSPSRDEEIGSARHIKKSTSK
jgi:hypothetical protein